MKRKPAAVLTAFFLCGFAFGCSTGPTAIPALNINAKKASARAFELHDTNQDGQLDADELTAAPGLAYAATRADKNSDSMLSPEEVVAMIEAWNEKSIGLLTLRCNVRYKKRPLVGASVRFEPEPFLDGQVETAIGLTDDVGDAFISVPKDKRPIADSPPGVQLGLYRVVISKDGGGKEIVPSKYNEETTLGQEVSFDDSGVLNGITYSLK